MFDSQSYNERISVWLDFCVGEWLICLENPGNPTT